MNYIDNMYVRLMGAYLQEFKETSKGTYTFRCPICGDSDTSRTKTRGYFYVKGGKYKFKCHNCGNGSSFQFFMKNQNYNLFQKYKKDMLMSTQQIKEKNEINADDIKTNTSKIFKKHAHIGNKILKSLRRASDVKFSRDYLIDRKIPSHLIDTLYYVDDINEITSKIEKYSKQQFKNNSAIVIPFINDGIVTHLQMRMFDSDMRYMTLECEETDTKIYGLNNINENDTVYVFEGAFDAMLCNGIAVCNGSLHTFIDYLTQKFGDDYVLVYDKDMIYNKQILDSVNKSIAYGCKIVLYDKQIVNSDAKDLNEMVINGLITNINNYFKDNTYTGFRAKMYLDKIKQIDKHTSPFAIFN